MANYPFGISLNGNSINSVILEITDDAAINTPNSKNFGGGYIRQKGALVEGWAIDSRVQYDVRFLIPFTQGGITFAYLESKYLLFRQDALP